MPMILLFKLCKVFLVNKKSVLQQSLNNKYHHLNRENINENNYKYMLRAYDCIYKHAKSLCRNNSLDQAMNIALKNN